MQKSDGQSPLVLHASCVAWKGRGLILVGPSGSGKSTTALHLMAFGADLVADDRTELFSSDGLWARAPDAIRGLIEARGMGLLSARTAGPVRVALVADLGRAEDQRLPPHRTVTFLGETLPLVLCGGGGPYPAALLQYLKEGRSA
ncbi:HPr kinase/phosphorylase [Halodurantibacterium flavum]|uniref:HPr kinase/phosphorylase n=1 Tax=Halodurantibacterium flavum TaxID=1382802 RepID=A0ABW4S2B7_9RHOB